MNGHSNTARPLREIGARTSIQSLRMAASSGTGERTTGVARVAQLANGGYAQ